jgi:hypothetical protein
VATFFKLNSRLTIVPVIPYWHDAFKNQEPSSRLADNRLNCVYRLYPTDKHWGLAMAHSSRIMGWFELLFGINDSQNIVDNLPIKYRNSIYFKVLLWKERY